MASEASPERPQLRHPHPYPSGPDFRPATPEPWTSHPSPAIPSSWPAPWGTARPAPPPPGLCSWHSTTLGSGPGVVPGVKGSWQRLGLMRLRPRAFGRPPDPASQLAVLQAGWAGLSGEGWLEVLITLSMFVCVTQPRDAFPSICPHHLLSSGFSKPLGTQETWNGGWVGLLSGLEKGQACPLH